LIYLDTSFVIHALTHGSVEDRALRSWIKAGVPLVISAVAWAELLCGPLEGNHLALIRHIVGEIAPLDEEHASLAAKLFNHSGRRRGSLADCMIAATAINAQAALATSNRTDFTRFAAEGLQFAAMEQPR